MEWFVTVVDTKNFVLCRYPSLKVQEIEISSEHEDKENGGLLLGPQSLKGVTLVQLSQYTWRQEFYFKVLLKT